jgi:DNA-binding response OmpR family regulator
MPTTKSKILIIEDDPFILRMYSQKFSNEGYIIYGAQTATAGLDLAKKITPDLILLDIILPDEDGLSLLKKIKRQKETAKIPVIILTNVNETPHREQAKIFGAVGYYVKAYLDPVEIVEKIKGILK